MFGLTLYSELLHGPALRTWNCVAHVVGALWQQVVQHLVDINNMPRSRRRHHSRSRSRTNSNDRDREPKRRKVESFESPQNRRSVSSEPEANAIVANAQNDCPVEHVDAPSDSLPPVGGGGSDATVDAASAVDAADAAIDTSAKCDSDQSVAHNSAESEVSSEEEEEEEEGEDDTKMDTSVVSLSELNTSGGVAQTLLKDGGSGAATPQKRLTPKQVQKRLESEKKKAERQREKDERQRVRQQEKDERQRVRQMEKDAKDAKVREERDAKQREKDAKDKEREAKRREKEEKDEVKRKEREAERLKKQAEVEEKNREKQKQEEKKQKAAAAFTKFFVAKPAGNEAKKTAAPDEEGVVSNYFMPFQLKSDMRLAPTTRGHLTKEEKEFLVEAILKQTLPCQYLITCKTSKRRSGKTWQNEDLPDDEVMIIESHIGEGILNTEKRGEVMKAKYLKFHANRRPPYYGTWRKTSKTISGKTPFAQDSIFNYEVDSDDEWEEEEEGEDIAGSDDEEKEPDSENDYEVDDEFFVPHGHLSDDEENDEEETIAPEMRKAKEKLLKNQFDEEHKKKMQKLKPRVIGCVWYNNNNNEDGAVDMAIDKFLKPYAIIANSDVTIKKRSEIEVKESRRKWRLEKELMPDLLRLLHGNVHNKRVIALEYFAYLAKKNIDIVANKMGMCKLIRSIAKWGRCNPDDPVLKKMCWLVKEETLTEFNHVSLTLPNSWQYCTDITSKETES